MQTTKQTSEREESLRLEIAELHKRNAELAMQLAVERRRIAEHGAYSLGAEAYSEWREARRDAISEKDERIAELERQLAEARLIAETPDQRVVALERQLTAKDEELRKVKAGLGEVQNLIISACHQSSLEKADRMLETASDRIAALLAEGDTKS